MADPKPTAEQIERARQWLESDAVLVECEHDERIDVEGVPESPVRCPACVAAHVAAEVARDREQRPVCTHGWRGGAPKDAKVIRDPCPTCGGQTFIGDGGGLTCANIPCREPAITEGWKLREKEAVARAVEPLEEAKNAAYSERNQLVALLASLYPSWLMRHPDSEEWEEDWRWMIGVQLPTGQATWHIHDSELSWFDHVDRRFVEWDGHSTEEKYERIRLLAQHREEK